MVKQSRGKSRRTCGPVWVGVPLESEFNLAFNEGKEGLASGRGVWNACVLTHAGAQTGSSEPSELPGEGSREGARRARVRSAGPRFLT